DLEHTVHPAQVERDDGALLVGRRRERTGDVRPTTEGDENGVGRDDGVDDRLHLRLVGGVDDDVRHARQVTGTDPHQVGQALAVGVDDPLEVVVADVLTPDGGGQRAG